MELEGSEGTGPLSEVRDDLHQFREQWRKELEAKARESEERGDNQEIQDDLHIQAREYFLQGVQHEQNGKLYDAIKFYKKAVNLVPDIEKEAFQFTGRQAGNNNKQGASGENAKMKLETPSDDGDVEVENLTIKFSTVKLDNQPLIQPQVPVQGTHIGQLPSEVINYILKWVVSSDLDLRSLEACAAVCRGFYLAARDEEIWRLVCVRVWGPSILSRKQDLWRDRYLSTVKVHFNGVYISKTTYIREGERSFQDHESYRAWHMVEYYRFIRLFPGGRCLMAISAEDPGLTCKLLSNKNFCSIQGSMFGEYRISDNSLVCVFHKHKPKRIVPKFSRKKRKDAIMYNDVPDQDFLVELTIKGSKSRTLVWKSYNILSKFSSGKERIDPVNLSETNYPRLKFSRVGSYHFESTAPLK